METTAEEELGRARPPGLRALGADEPPAEVEIGGRTRRRVHIYKHDTWAATALYEGDGERYVVKMHRRQPALGILPMRWYGRFMARRERRTHERLAAIETFPEPAGPVRVRGKVLRHAVAYRHIEARPYEHGQDVAEDFFPRLRRMLDAIHERDGAYVDLNKRSNILVGPEGRPHLIDFQLTWFLPGWWPSRVILGIFQAADRYHLAIHEFRHRRSRRAADESPPDRPRRPWFLRFWRSLTSPLQTLRRWFLVRIGVRRGEGGVETERAPEEAVRLARSRKDEAAG